MRTLVVASTHAGLRQANRHRHIARKEVQALLQYLLGFLELAVFEVRLAERAIELRDLRIFKQQGFQLLDRGSRILCSDVGDCFAVARLERRAAAVPGEAVVVIEGQARISKQRAYALAHQRIAQRVLMADAPDLLGPAARLRDTVRGHRVIDQEFNGLDPVRAHGVAVQLLKERGHAQGVVARARHRIDTDAIRLELLAAGVIDLMLDRGALGRQHSPFHRTRRSAPRGRPEQDRGQHGCG